MLHNSILGQQFGNLKVIADQLTGEKNPKVLAKCVKCGEIVERYKNSIGRGRGLHCEWHILPGQKYGCNKVLKNPGTTSRKNVFWVRCECGNTRYITRRSLLDSPATCLKCTKLSAEVDGDHRDLISWAGYLGVCRQNIYKIYKAGKLEKRVRKARKQYDLLSLTNGGGI